MTNRQDILEEKLLRENIRKAIQIVKNKHAKQEQYVRSIVSTLLKEATIQKYEYTSLNLLAHFIKEVVGDPSKPDSTPAFKDAYTDLTSSHEDRELFVEYILDFATEDFRTIDADKEPQSLGQSFVDNGFQDEQEEEQEEEPEEDEVITVSIGDLEEKGGDLSTDPETSDEEDEEEIFTIGEDAEEVEIQEENTGIRKYSREAYKRIGPPLRRYYGQVQKDSRLKKAVAIDGKEYAPGDLSERDLFRIYLKKNLLLWSERYEDEFFDTAPEVDVDIQSNEEEQESEQANPFEM